MPPKRPDYTPEQVTRALLQLVANGGNCAKTSRDLIDDEFQVTEPTLRQWKNDLHAERYRRLEEGHGAELEREMVEKVRETIQHASSLEDLVLEEIKTALTPDEDGKIRIDARDLPALLRSLTDTKAKSVDRMLTLTGRQKDPRDPTAKDAMTLLQQMAAKGYVRLAVGMELTPDAMPPGPASPPSLPASEA